MGNGQHLSCQQKCVGVPLVMQGHLFEVDLYILPICGLYIVLGMQWLRTLGTCLHYHNALTMEFRWKGKQVRLMGESRTNPSPVTFAQMRTILEAGDFRGLFHLTATKTTTVASQPNDDSNISTIDASLPVEAQGILLRHHKVFTTPSQLPPYQSSDHRIHLQNGSSPVNVRPYHYPYFQKDTMEKLVQEMLDCGYIRPSNSPYSSPVLLVLERRMALGDFVLTIAPSTISPLKTVFQFPPLTNY